MKLEMKNYQHTYCFKSRRTLSLSALKEKYLNAHLPGYLQKSEKPKCFELRSSICLIKHGRVDLNHILATRGLVLLSSSCYTRKEKAGNLHGVGALQAATWAVSVTHSSPGPAFLSLVQCVSGPVLCASLETQGMWLLLFLSPDTGHLIPLHLRFLR